ncbi:restriction endonuclease subunit S [Micromonospora sp. WMMD712]|uniref:restriction endonuclease subunit S n=1 Tax=Micromonospora TaxID=1873 RepID=UPI00249BE59F|nr:restriction endonuclease subunit S [Micromonospora sp. WMMD712]WFE57089.1 restriction endonuclease subunit S [Micromonospora sp. WMMD712]
MTDLPKGWVNVKLDDVVAINPRAFDQWPDDNDLVSLVPMASVEAETGRIDASQGKRYGEVKNRSLTPFQEGDVLFAKVTPCMENGKIAVARGLASGRALGSTELFVLRSFGAVDPAYLSYFLLQSSTRKKAQAAMTGAVGLRRVPRSWLAELDLPIPPLAEQRRIVAILERHLQTLATAKRNLQLVDRGGEALVRSIYAEMYKDRAGVAARCDNLAPMKSLARIRRDVWSRARPGVPYKEPVSPDLEVVPPAPAGWEICSLEAVTDPVRIIRYGILKPRIREGGVVPYVEVKDLAGCVLGGKVLHRTSRELDEQFSGARIRPGDVVMAVRGSYERSAVVPPDLMAANISRDVARISVLPGVNPAFVHAYLQSPFAQNYFKRHARGVAVKGINISTLRRLPILLPSIEVQTRIVQEVSSCLSMVDRLSSSIQNVANQAEGLKNALMSRAFNGQLVPQDPDDEPASELLARIKAERAATIPKQRTRSRRTPKELPAPATRVTGDDYQQETLPL